MAKRHEIKFASYDRLFPNQDTLPKGGLGNLIALPLQLNARRNNNSVFIDQKFQPYDDQWSFLSSIRKFSESSFLPSNRFFKYISYQFKNQHFP